MLKEAIEALLLMLSPFTPHMAEELWEHTGHDGSERYRHRVIGIGKWKATALRGFPVVEALTRSRQLK